MNTEPWTYDLPREPDTNVTMRHATSEDFTDVLDVVQDAALRIQEKGIHQWRLYLTDAGVRRVRERLEGANDTTVYLTRRNNDGRSIAVMSLEWSDCEYWGDRGKDGLAGYIHMLSVHRAAAGTRLGERMMWWAQQIIASEKRPLARLDCWAGSAVLPGYYERLGFTCVERVNGPNGSLLMEKRVIP
jgi:ribosomal protein S18 acetylase RimI-like enzyme